MHRRGPLLALGALLLAVRLSAADFNPADATNAVGLELYRQVAAAAPAGNVALSPYSIASALALAYTGAAGDTREEMGRVLRFPGEDQPLVTGFASLRASLDRITAESVRVERQGEEAGGHSDIIEWHTADRLFGQQGYPFRQDFLGQLQEGYGASLEPLDFVHRAEESRALINGWVRDQTRGRIRTLIPPGGVDAASRLVLVNALYLKAPWARAFEERTTTDLPFFSSAQRSSTVPTMRRTAEIEYLKGDGFTAVALPYLGGDLQMLVFLPEGREGLAALTARLSPAALRAYAHLGPRRLVSLSLPKFRLEGTTVDLGRALQALGLHRAFDLPRGSADFTRAAPRLPDGGYLFISQVYHQTVVAIDEEGTEATAGTAVVMSVGLAVQLNPPPPPEFRVDHPFFFAIQDRTTGVCLFLGSVIDPQ